MLSFLKVNAFKHANNVKMENVIHTYQEHSKKTSFYSMFLVWATTTKYRLLIPIQKQ